MTESTGAVSTDPRLVDPLSEVTRKERLYLLGSSTVGVTIVFTGLVPSEIRALGIAFARADRQSLLVILALVIAYFLAAFLIYAASDFLAWRNLFQARAREQLRQQIADEMADRATDEVFSVTVSSSDHAEQRSRRELERYVDNRLKERSSVLLIRLTGPVSFLRALFEFGLPVIYGIFAIAVLLVIGLPPVG